MRETNAVTDQRLRSRAEDQESERKERRTWRSSINSLAHLFTCDWLKGADERGKEDHGPGVRHLYLCRGGHRVRPLNGKHKVVRRHRQVTLVLVQLHETLPVRKFKELESGDAVEGEVGRRRRSNELSTDDRSARNHDRKQRTERTEGRGLTSLSMKGRTSSAFLRVTVL